MFCCDPEAVGSNQTDRRFTFLGVCPSGPLVGHLVVPAPPVNNYNVMVLFVHETKTNELRNLTLHKKATIQQVTTMLATSNNVLFPSYNHLLNTTDQYWWPFTRWHLGNNQSVVSSVPVVSRWLWPENRTFLEVASTVLIWWIVAFFVRVTWWVGNWYLVAKQNVNSYE